MRHAFFADMGGFLVQCSDEAQPAALNAEQLLLLINEGHIKYPLCDEVAVEDKNTYDGLSR